MKIPFVLALLSLSGCATAIAAPPPASRDVAYPGVLTLHVDATDTLRRILQVRETIPVRPGPLILRYPQWLPGTHSSSGPIASLAGLVISDGRQRIPWTRDALNTYAFHVNVPAGASRLDIEFQFVSPRQESELLGLPWNTVVLYPAGHYASRIVVEPSIKLPEGWQLATSLDTVERGGGEVRFAPVTLQMLIDSPLYAGAHSKRIDLDPGASAPVHLNLFADADADLQVGPEALAAYSKLVREAHALFRSRHYARYEFLLSLSDTFEKEGLEHHGSSENGHGAAHFTDWASGAPGRDLLAHEYTHSWNGKFRRPSGLVTPDYDVPMQSSLLWVYEGMTEYWGYVLSARSGLWSPAQAREHWADVAATYDRDRPGRSWRDLQDTTDQPKLSGYDGDLAWASWQREADYYSEAALIWLDVDTRIRELTHEARSLDDFAVAFFGIRDGEVGPLPYTFDDIVNALQRVAPNDWGTFLRSRLTSHETGAPLDGVRRGGWKVVYTPEASEYTQAADAADDSLSLLYSIGVTVTKDAELSEVRWGSPAFEAGLVVHAKIIAVDGREYDAGRLKQAIRAAQGSSNPIELLVKSKDRFRSVQVKYFGGLKYPHLERIEGTLDRLGAIMAPRT